MVHMIIILGIRCADIECVYLSRPDNTSSVVFEGYLLARFVGKMLNPVSHLACKKVPVDHFSWGCIFWYTFLAQFDFLILVCKMPMVFRSSLDLALLRLLVVLSTFSFFPSLLLSVHSLKPKANCLRASVEHFQVSEGAVMARSMCPWTPY